MINDLEGKTGSWKWAEGVGNYTIYPFEITFKVNVCAGGNRPGAPNSGQGRLHASAKRSFYFFALFLEAFFHCLMFSFDSCGVKSHLLVTS